MKIGKIENQGEIFRVHIIPNRVEKFFGKKEKYEEYKYTGNVYQLGEGGVYVKRDGKYVENLSEIQKILDNYRRRW